MLSVFQTAVIVGLTSFTVTISAQYLVIKAFFDWEHIGDDVFTFVLLLFTTIVFIHLIVSYWIQSLTLMRVSFYGTVLLAIVWFIALVVYLYYSKEEAEYLADIEPAVTQTKRRYTVYALLFFGMSTGLVFVQNSVGVLSHQTNDLL